MLNSNDDNANSGTCCTSRPFHSSWCSSPLVIESCLHRVPSHPPPCHPPTPSPHPLILLTDFTMNRCSPPLHLRGRIFPSPPDARGHWLRPGRSADGSAQGGRARWEGRQGALLSLPWRPVPLHPQVNLGDHQFQLFLNCFPSCRPTFLVVDSDNSLAFSTLPHYFDMPLVVLMSPQVRKKCIYLVHGIRTQKVKHCIHPMHLCCRTSQQRSRSKVTRAASSHFSSTPRCRVRFYFHFHLLQGPFSLVLRSYMISHFQ